jgi:ribosome-binding protein aMBF1 (putative translation factor)
MTMGEAKTVLCGSCHVGVEQRVNPDGQMMVVCPTCGQSDTLENAAREAGEYLTDKLMREGMAGHKMPGITVTHPPQRNYRFILAD